MKKWHQKVGIVAVLLLAVGTVVAVKESGRNTDAGAANPRGAVKADTAESGAGGTGAAPQAADVPRLVDLGAKKCIPCRLMAPILDQLREDYHGRMGVEFIDVWDNPGAGHQYGIRAIPTQIFYDASGRELFRHEGFMSREDILNRWKALGIEFPDATAKDG